MSAIVIFSLFGIRKKNDKIEESKQAHLYVKCVASENAIRDSYFSPCQTPRLELDIHIMKDMLQLVLLKAIVAAVYISADKPKYRSICKTRPIGPTMRPNDDKMIV